MPTPPTLEEHGLNRRARRLFSKILRIPFKGSRWSWKTHVVKTWKDDKGRTHNSHFHTFSVTSAAGSAHTHTVNTITTSGMFCDYPYSSTHYHAPTGISNESTHTHTLSGNTSTETAVDLNHTHSISVTSGSTSHSHGYPTPSAGQTCMACTVPHAHAVTGATTSTSHTHSYSGNTGTGSGTLQSHTHSLPSPTGAGSSHTHGGGTITGQTVNCELGWGAHDSPGVGTSGSESSHTHTVSGNTDAGGEPAAGAIRRHIPHIGVRTSNRQYLPSLRMEIPGFSSS